MEIEHEPVSDRMKIKEAKKKKSKNKKVIEHHSLRRFYFFSVLER